jgi:hypothetical protein
MPRVDSLKPAIVTAGLVVVALGPVIPPNLVRRIYMVHTHNTFVGANIVTFRDAVPNIFDFWVHIAVNDEVWWPIDGVNENSVPLYSISGGPTGGAGVTTQVIADAGACWVRILYEDVPGGR